MVELDFHTVVERFHTFQNPTSEAKLDRLIDYCDFSAGHRVLDVGCGKGWLLRRIAMRHAVRAEGIEVRQSFLDEAQQALMAEPVVGEVEFHRVNALDFSPEPASYDVAMCIGASFAIGSFEEMIDWLVPVVKPGGVLAVGDIYARNVPVAAESAVHFSGGQERTITATAEYLNQDGRSLIGLIDSSNDDWDRYESMHWVAADRWLRENPRHPEREAFKARNEQVKMDHIKFDRKDLGWALFVCRVN